MTKPCSETHHRDTRHLVRASPPVVCIASRTLLGGKGSLPRGQIRRALASCASFLRRMISRWAAPYENQMQSDFFVLRKTKTQVVVDKTS